MHSDNNAEKFGQILGYAPGNVPAYSSDYATADDKEYPKRSAFRHYLDGIYMGYKWQCVEFARRWLYLNYGYIFDDIPMAYEIFDLRSVRDIANNSRLPLYAFRNGSQRKPEVGCLLIWAEGGEFEDTGHVAIITDVHDDRVCVAEQNVRHKKWAERQHYARCLQAKTTENGEYWIQCSFSDGEILGWMLQTSDATHAEPNENLDPDLFQLVSRDVPKHQTQRAWLNEANLDESAYVEMMAGHKMACDPILDHRYYLLSLTAEKQLELATNELHHLFMQATEYVIDHPEVYAKFNLPNACYSKIKQSWNNRKNQLITSRFDFSITAQGTKVYEYNCDSASCYMEAGKIQGKWAKHHKVREGIDAGYNLVSELIKAWKKCQANQLVHILRDHDKEEAGAVHMDVADQPAGIDVAHDALDRGEGQIDMRRVVHHENDPGDDLQRQTERKNDAPDPHPVQVLGCGDHQCVIEQANDRQPRVQPLFSAGRRLVMVVRNSRHSRVSLSQQDRCFVDEFSRRYRQVLRRWPFADAARGVVVRPVARAEPTTDTAIKRVVTCIAKRNAAKVCTNAHLDQPFAGFIQSAVFVGRCGRAVAIRVACDLVNKVCHVDAARVFDLYGRPASDKDRLAEPFDSDLRAFCYARHVHSNRGQGQNVCRRVHLVDQRPNRGTGGNRACAGCCVVQEVPPGAFVVFCVGHEVISI